MSRGLSPIPIEDLLPPDITAFLNSTEMQTTQQSPVQSPVHTPPHLVDPDVISLSDLESDSDNIPKRPVLESFLQPRTRARSPEIVPETQPLFRRDPLVCPHLSFLTYVYAHSIFPDVPDTMG